MDYLATNQATDHGLIAPTAESIKQEAGDRIIEAVADKGYEQAEDMVSCLEKGIIPNVILPDGQDTYELEIEYEEAGELNTAGTNAEELKRCLHAGVVPEAYADVIEGMEVAEVRRKVSDGPEQKVVFCQGSGKGSGLLSRRGNPQEKKHQKKWGDKICQQAGVQGMPIP